MQADTATPFKPFDPGAVPATADLPAAEKPDKKPRPSRAVAPKIPPAPKHKRPTRKKTAKKRSTTKTAHDKKIVDKAFQKTRTAINENLYAGKKPRKPRVQKVDLDTALLIGAMLKPSDLKVFGEIRQHLGTLNKATRRRVLGAIGKVFG